MIPFTENQTILFQGDSITQADRDLKNPYSMGSGYANMIAAWIGASHPQLSLHFLNRGISGNRVTDLRQRWQTDTLDLKPDWLSIMIGINDCWRRFDRNLPTSTEEYEHGFRELLLSVKKNLPKCRLIIIEPFLLPFPEDREAWRDDLDPKIHSARRLAREFSSHYVPMDGIFAAAATQRPLAFWAPDGVHPSPEGHALIAQSWIKTVSSALI